MHSTGAVKTIVQCDFDGTITLDDVSFLLLDAFANGDWRQLLQEYREGKISVGSFNTKAFVMVKADRRTLTKFVREKAKLRAGFNELLACCQRRGFQFAIVSNGLRFYIEAILEDMGVDNVEVFAAQTRFGPDGIEARYIGPGGRQLPNGLKEAYIRRFLRRGYRVIYVGNGPSDILSARLAHHVFATGLLLALCKETSLECMPFVDLQDVAKGLELIS